jgi:hypothetical protein
LSRAELKAYEARRAAELRRASMAPVTENDTYRATANAPTTAPHRVYSRADEVRVIQSDLRRLLMILALLAVLLIVATIILR